ncbi:MAG: metallophosphoesterase [Elusimicrobia bacterium]|nr:metallophosphoesterase [Elusimicrobiota bacterium]
MATLNFLFFLFLFLSIYLSMHYYVYARVSKGLGLSRAFSRYLLAGFLLSALSFFIFEILSRKTAHPLLRPFHLLSSSWLGVISIATTTFIIADVVRLMFRKERSGYYATVAAVTVSALLSVYSFVNVVFRKPLIKELNIPISKLPAELSGFSIVQLSDLHLHPLKSERWLETIVDEVNKLHPDVVVITGDLIDANLCKMDKHCGALGRIESVHGVYAVAGNHEFYVGLDTFEKIAADSGITVLRDESVTIAGGLVLAGIDDFLTKKRFTGTSPDLKSILEKCDRTKPLILLSHQPDVFDEAVKYGVDLQLSGHTHAGQVPPMDFLVMLYFKYPVGLYAKNLSHLYTTPGTGTWSPPMRLFTRSEIVRVTLTRRD